MEFLNIIKERIESEFTNKYKLIIKMTLFRDDYNNKNSNSIYNMRCKYYFYPPNDERLSTFQDENVLINGVDGVHQGFYFLASEINDNIYEDISYTNLDANEIIKKKDNIEKEKKEIQDSKIIKK